MKMKSLEHKGKAFSKYYFLIRKKLIVAFNKHVEKHITKEKRQFYKKYKVQPMEEDIEEMKKEVVMQEALYLFAIVVVVFIFLFL